MTSGARHTVEHVGQYEYDKTNILGHGAFAVVYRGINCVVSNPNSFHCPLTLTTPVYPWILDICSMSTDIYLSLMASFVY